MNFVFHGDYFLVVFKFIPMLVFFTCTFGYMDFLIIYKWLQVWDPALAPSIINTMIDMVIGLGAVNGPKMFDLDGDF
jgi:V-type H+-transporting ATPase subunit a